jgi:hypothetical protein
MYLYYIYYQNIQSTTNVILYIPKEGEVLG